MDKKTEQKHIVQEKTSTKISFWTLLSQHTIEIPIIQRDYAQGRKGKTELRRSFLKDMKESLVDNKPMMLDFVYGSPAGNKFYPLDGQQRLTTLWLIHWYIALRSGKLEENADHESQKILSNFTYSTRVSSQKFCEELCSHSFSKDISDITKYIQKQTWYYSSWSQDPTVQSILRMLHGTTIKNKDGKYVKANDGVEQVFGDGCDFENIWLRLKGQCPIEFYYIDLVGLKLTDDLYIKMNSRGKQLTNFENFKADIVGYLATKEREEKKLKEELHDESPIIWETYNDVHTGFPIMLDTTWAHIFWRENVCFWKEEQKRLEKDKKKVDFTVDDSYFGFLNRIFFSCLLTEKQAKETSTEDNDMYLFSATDIEGTSNKEGKNKTFDYLYGPKDSRNNQFHDELIEYTSFDHYCYLVEGKTASVPERVFKTINNVLYNFGSCTNKSIVDCFPQRHQQTSFRFIPCYTLQDNGYKISPITLPHRIVFFAICRYFEQLQFENDTFTRWMRVVWNIVDFVAPDAVSTMIGVLRLVDELSCHISDLYQWMSSPEFHVSSKVALAQVCEECEKAEKMLKIEQGKDELSIKSIQDAEEYFNGSIRFLFHNENAQLDWTNFERKWNKAKEILGVTGLSEIYSKDAMAIRIILSYCTSWDSQIGSWTNNNHKIFDVSRDCWIKNILLTTKSDNITPIYCNPVHHLLMGDSINSTPRLSDENIWKQTAYDALVNTNLISLCYQDTKNSEKYYVRWTYDNYSLYPSSEGYILTMPNRNKVLSECCNNGKIKIDDYYRTNTVPRIMFKGWDIYFTFEEHKFLWKHTGEIVLSETNKMFIDSNVSKEISSEEFLEILRTSL